MEKKYYDGMEEINRLTLKLKELIGRNVGYNPQLLDLKMEFIPDATEENLHLKWSLKILVFNYWESRGGPIKIYETEKEHYFYFINQAIEDIIEKLEERRKK